MFDYSSTAQAVKERTLIKNVYMWMAAGLALTGLTSLWMASDPNRMVSFVQGGTMWLLFIAELVLVFYLSARILSMKPLTATLCFAGYSILNGLTLSVIFYAYTMESITSTFFITAATFGGMALYATITKRD
ncbi:MAG: Bax inhibitor-1 family protein, partial [Spirochaetia bacterium]|nr:Bax inhibitor-1 family protein [Spirochaetia bacterium]